MTDIASDDILIASVNTSLLRCIFALGEPLRALRSFVVMVPSSM
nr:MAG TPA: hypothetical protein [Caudoviricetes sp.]